MPTTQIPVEPAVVSHGYIEKLTPGAIRPVSGKALRFNEGKPELSYLLTFPDALKAFAKICMYGANKYERGNYLRGATVTQQIDSLMRHLSSYYNGEDIDPESGEPHVGHVVWNALQLAQMALTRPDMDDRINANKFKSTGWTTDIIKGEDTQYDGC